jgi:hypothetical protein
MTRKARKSRKTSKTKSRRQGQRYKIKGGAFLAAGLGKAIGSGALKAASGAGSLVGSVAQKIPGLRSTKIPVINEKGERVKTGTDLNDVKQVLKFSLGAIIMSPLYIATVLANMPLNTIHNLTGKRIDEDHSNAIGIQLYKYMFEGYKREPTDEGLVKRIGEHRDKFDVPEGVTVKKSIIVKCDNCKKDETVQNGGVQRGGYMNTFKTFDEIMGVKQFNGIKGALGEMGFEKYKEEIAKNVAYQNDQILHKLKELEFEVDSIKETFTDRKPELKKNIKNLKTEILFKAIVVCQTLIDDCTEKTDNKPVKINKDMVVVSNPYRRRDMTSSRFKMDVCFLHDNCKTECPNCTLFDNMRSIYHSYARILLSTFRGKNNNLYVIIDLLFTLLKKTIGSEKPVIGLDHIETMRYSGDTSSIQKNLEEPIVLFKQLICEYGIYEEIKKQFKIKIGKLDPEQRKLTLNKLNSII